MADRFANSSGGISAPASSAAAVTPSDVADLSSTARALYVGGAGDVRVRLVDDAAAVTFVGVPAGSILPVRAARVYATGTSATAIVALA